MSHYSLWGTYYISVMQGVIKISGGYWYAVPNIWYAVHIRTRRGQVWTQEGLMLKLMVSIMSAPWRWGFSLSLISVLCGVPSIYLGCLAHSWCLINACLMNDWMLLTLLAARSQVSLTPKSWLLLLYHCLSYGWVEDKFTYKYICLYTHMNIYVYIYLWICVCVIFFFCFVLLGCILRSLLNKV